MLLRILCLCLLCGVIQADGLDYPSIWRCDEDKFHWYCDQEKQKPTSPQTTRLDINHIHTAEQLRVELKRREDIAIMQPTDAHIKDYLTLWQFTQEKGAVFADHWRRVVWQHPELDYAQKRPANNSAVKLYDAQRTVEEETQLKHLAKQHGLIFFFKSTCSYCHAMAPTLSMLSQRYGIEVLGVSLDGKGIPGFPHPKDGRVQAAKWGVERVPALFIGSKQTGEHAAIGFGVMALSEILNRIFVLTRTQPGEKF